MRYQPTHRRATPLHRRLFVRASATAVVAAALVSPPLLTGTAQASGDCGAATTPAVTLSCVEQTFRTVLDAVAQAPAGVSVPLPGPIVGQTSLIDFVYQAADQAVQQANNCVALTDPTCALIVRTAELEAKAIETMATTCVNGTNPQCSQLEQLAATEITALVTLANQCIGGTDPTCNTLTAMVSQLLGEAITCTVGPLEPAAPSTLPNPVIVTYGSSTGPLPDLTVTCTQVKNAAAQLTAECASGSNAACDLAITAVAKSPCLNNSDEVACANDVAPPPAPVQTDVDPETVFPANELRGTVVFGSGLGAGGVTVSFYIDPGMDPHDTVTPDLLGSTTTDANGHYLATITPDSYATSLASANGGVLNVMASATVSVAIPGDPLDPPILEIANGVTPLTLGGSAQYWLSQPPTLLLTPAGQVDLSATPASALDAPDPNDLSVGPSINYQPTADNSTVPTLNGVPTGDDPFIVNGVNYRQAIPSEQGPCEPPAHQPMFESAHVLNQKERWIVAGETHAWWNAASHWDYAESVADSTIETGFSTDDYTGWIAGGYSTEHNDNPGVRIDAPAEGPYYGHQELMGFNFKNEKLKYQCYGSDKIYYKYEASPGLCMFDWKPGKDVSQYDGSRAYMASNPSFRKVLQRGETITIYKGKAYRYTNSFNAFGFQGKTVSGHSKNVEQGITGGRNAVAEHDIWGNNKSIQEGPNIMYSW